MEFLRRWVKITYNYWLKINTIKGHNYILRIQEIIWWQEIFSWPIIFNFRKINIIPKILEVKKNQKSDFVTFWKKKIFILYWQTTLIKFVDFWPKLFWIRTHRQRNSITTLTLYHLPPLGFCSFIKKWWGVFPTKLVTMAIKIVF